MDCTSDGKCARCFAPVGTGGCTNPVCRDYTFRRFHPQKCEIELAEAKKVMLEVAEELAPAGAWMDENRLTSLARKLREAAR